MSAVVLSYSFTSHSSENGSFRRRSSQLVCWLISEETKPKTTKANNTGTKWP